MDIARVDDYDTISDSLRPWLASKLKAMYEALEPYVNGEFGEVHPNHAAAAVQVLKQLGALYRVQDRPRANDELISVEQARVLALEAVAQARVEWEQAREVTQALARERILGAARS